jgi:hypothetical protein
MVTTSSNIKSIRVESLSYCDPKIAEAIYILIDAKITGTKDNKLVLDMKPLSKFTQYF